MDLIKFNKGIRPHLYTFVTLTKMLSKSDKQFQKIANPTKLKNIIYDIHTKNVSFENDVITMIVFRWITCNPQKCKLVIPLLNYLIDINVYPPTNEMNNAAICGCYSIIKWGIDISLKYKINILPDRWGMNLTSYKNNLNILKLCSKIPLNIGGPILPNSYCIQRNLSEKNTKVLLWLSKLQPPIIPTQEQLFINETHNFAKRQKIFNFDDVQCKISGF
ncbi:MAG: hypothetical protein JKX76_00925 [Colwellia sp.]|nr:hypothetical protein [Colwellia sp.]